MNFRIERKALAIGLLAAVVASGATPVARATILIFDQTRDAATHTQVVSTTAGALVEQDYGDRVASASESVLGGTFTYRNDGEGFTPNVVVDYFVGDPPDATGVRLWTTQYGDLTNVVFGKAASGSLTIRFTADQGFLVQLHHFDLAGWANADYTISAVNVFAGAVPLFTQSDVPVEGDFNDPRHTSFEFVTPLSASELVLQIDYSNLAGSIQDNIGIDNIRFGQDPPAAAVPEPSTWLLVGAGVAVMLAFRRRSSFPRVAAPLL